MNRISVDFDNSAPEAVILIELLSRAERLAEKLADGHLTIMRFTTGWKVMLGTPNLDDGGRAEVGRLPAFNSLEEALEHVISCNS